MSVIERIWDWRGISHPVATERSTVTASQWGSDQWHMLRLGKMLARRRADLLWAAFAAFALSSFAAIYIFTCRRCGIR